MVDNEFVVLAIATVAVLVGVLYWVACSIQELLIAQNRMLKNNAIKHRKKLELFRKELKK